MTHKVSADHFTMKVMADLSAASLTATMALGHKLGFYKIMAGTGWMKPGEIAALAGTNERLTTEWLSTQAAGGYVIYDDGSYQLPDECAKVLADRDSRIFLAEAFDLVEAMWLSDAASGFRGSGLPWGEQPEMLSRGLAGLTKPIYRSFLLRSWLPSLDGMVEKLGEGVEVADIGCGMGVATSLMAEAYPASTFRGYDYHVADSGDNLSFQECDAVSYLGTYDLICFFYSLHDMGDPLAAARYARKRLVRGGTLMVVEPKAADDIAENIKLPLAPLFYANSTFFCVPHAVSEGGQALGNQAGEGRIGAILTEAGFDFRCVYETPFNFVLEARCHVK